MIYYILFKGDDNNLMDDSQMLGEESFGKFWPGGGYDLLNKIVNDLMIIKISGVFNLGDINMSYFHLAEDLIRKHGNENSKIIKVIEGNKSQFILNTQKLNDLIELHKNDV